MVFTMADITTNIEAGVVERSTTETTSLLHAPQSWTEAELTEHDTHEPYFTVALKELKWMTTSSFWTALALLLQSLIPFVNVVSVGHLGATQLAAMVLSTNCYAVIASAPSIGMMGAMETFCGNAYTASRDKTLVGFHLQRGLVAVFAHLIIAVPILLNGERILLAIGQEPLIAHLSGQYLNIQILGILPMTLFEACKCFLQSQELMSGGTTVLGFVVPIHATINYLLVHSTYGIGYKGAAVATVISDWLMLCGILIYIKRSRAIEYWGRWDPKALRNMYEFYKLAIPSVITVCASCFCFELLSVSSSYFGAISLAATSIAINTNNFTFQISSGIGYSSGPRIGNLIGAGKPRWARISRDISLLVVAATGAIVIIFLTFCGRLWISVYTSDAEVVHETLKLMPVFCAYVIFDG
ncbi:ethionine resistance protein, partial [Coemansia guatemalensis]